MGVSVEGGKKGHGVDIDINLVPFIDMMSVLVAFLLLTAVWTNLAQLSIKAGGVGRDSEQTPPETPPINLSVLVASDGLWVGVTTGQPQKIDKIGEDYDYESLKTELVRYKKESGIFNERDDIEVAAEDAIEYQYLVNVMDTAIAAEFLGVRYVDPQSLSVRFKQ
jgi:biopolymer transport protein ExbD